jgi:DNA repair exonuclease SbcCD ATPase subunit
MLAKYCDALEAISSKSSTLKVMAITHDPAMKARFPQSIDIIRDESGSMCEETTALKQHEFIS